MPPSEWSPPVLLTVRPPLAAICGLAVNLCDGSAPVEGHLLELASWRLQHGGFKAWVFFCGGQAMGRGRRRQAALREHGGGGGPHGLWRLWGAAH